MSKHLAAPKRRKVDEDAINPQPQHTQTMDELLHKAHQQLQQRVDRLHRAFTAASHCHQQCLDSQDAVVANIRQAYGELIDTLTEQRDRLIAKVYEDEDGRYKAAMERMKQQMEDIRAQIKRTEGIVQDMADIIRNSSTIAWEEMEALKTHVVAWAVEKAEGEDISAVWCETLELKGDADAVKKSLEELNLYHNVAVVKV